MGGASGATIGYIVANVPGAVAGGFAGNRLGAVRDAKGKSVAQVFSGMESSKKAEVSVLYHTYGRPTDDRSSGHSLSRFSDRWVHEGFERFSFVYLLG